MQRRRCRQNIHELIVSSSCPAVIVRATLENELRAVQEWEAQETQKERQRLMQELGRRKGKSPRPRRNSLDCRNGTGGLNGKAAVLITRIDIDAGAERKNYLVQAKQGDKATRFVSVLIVEDGKEYAPPADADLIANFQKPDEKFAYNAAKIDDGNRILVELTNQVLAVSGEVVCEIEIRAKDSSQVLTSCTFTVKVGRSNRNENAILSSNEMTAFDAKWATLNSSMEEYATAERLRAEAEQNRVNAETARENAESARNSAETSRTKAETARQTAEGKRETNTQAAIKNAQDATNKAAEATKKAGGRAGRPGRAGADSGGLQDAERPDRNRRKQCCGL